MLIRLQRSTNGCLLCSPSFNGRFFVPNHTEKYSNSVHRTNGMYPEYIEIKCV